MSIERLTQSKRRRRLSKTYPDVTIEECWLQAHEENSPWFQTIVFEGPREAIEKLAPQGSVAKRSWIGGYFTDEFGDA